MLSAACQLVGEALCVFTNQCCIFNNIFCFGLNTLYNKIITFMKKNRKKLHLLGQPNLTVIFFSNFKISMSLIFSMKYIYTVLFTFCSLGMIGGDD